MSSGRTLPGRTWIWLLRLSLIHIFLVFDLADPDNIARAVQGEPVGTLVYEG